MDAKERRKVPAFVRILALAYVRQSMLEMLHRGLCPITRPGDYSDVVVIDADGRRIPWPELSRFNEDEMRDLMREIVNKLYTFFVKAEDPDFKAWADFVRPQSYHWDRPKIDKVMMHYVQGHDALCKGIRPRPTQGWPSQVRRYGLIRTPNAGNGRP